MADTLAELNAEGVSLWLDDISRDRLRTGNLAELVGSKHIVGVTSNPTIFARALDHGDAYDEQLHELRVRQVALDGIVRYLMAYDVRWACDVLRPAYEASSGSDGRVSIEVDPRLASDSDRSTFEAKALWWLVDRPNAMVKIPATDAGIVAIAAATAAGVNVNVTLIFGLRRYEQVMDAYLTGLEQAQKNGHDLSAIHSVASFFVSRVDTEIDHRLDAIGGRQAAALRGKAGIANARLAYQLFEQMAASRRWRGLAVAGAHLQRPLWASTGVKDLAYPDTMYAVELVAPNTVNTLPEATLDAVADHAILRGNTVAGSYDDARQVLDDLEAVGIRYDDVIATLEAQGVNKFVDAYAHLTETLRTHLAAPVAARG